MATKAFSDYSEEANRKLEMPQEATTKDIFETILSSSLPFKEKQPKRMANEVFNLLIAGSLTTSKTAVVAMYHILDNPEVYKCLKAELLSEIRDKHALPNVKTLQKLPMLVMRCYPFERPIF